MTGAPPRLLLALAVVLAPAAGRPAAPPRGERAFQRCHACHSALAADERLPGPNLRCVLGRRAGALPGFEFSPAMAQAGARGLVWTRAALDAFLADPPAVVPGTSMARPDLPGAADRRDVLDYLEAAGRGCPGAASSVPGPAPRPGPAPGRGGPAPAPAGSAPPGATRP